MTRDALLAFAAFPERLAEAARAAAARPVPAGEWTPEQVVRHLIAVDVQVAQRRLRDLAAGPGARWAWTEPAPWDGEPDLDLGGVLARFAAERAATVSLARSLDDTAWARTGTHTVYGELDGDGVIELGASHDEEHLRGLG
jgi:hypothetical protein